MKADCDEALATLDRLLAMPAEEMPPVQVYNGMAEVSRCLVRLRDALIDRRRAGDAQAAERLEHVNRALSIAFGAEYPLVGVRRQRIEATRDQLRTLLGEDGGGQRS